MDYDWLVIGSGFGGSVSALRLAEKGYRVGVVEAGRRWADHDFATSGWQLRRFVWAPRLGLRGTLRISTFRHVSVVSGAGVGGGSLAYANTLYAAPEHVYDDPVWRDLAAWRSELAPCFAEARRMLGVTTYAPPDGVDDPGDVLLQRLGAHLGVAATYRKADLGIFLGEPGRTVPDPFLDGAGPERTGCTHCGDCILGCRVGAKNTLVKNYLWLAERLGVRIHPETEVTGIRPIGADDGSDGYLVTTRRPGVLARRGRTYRVRGVVLAAGVLGTTGLLHACRRDGLPGLSARVGDLVRTNGEYVPGVLLPDTAAAGLERRPSITSSIHPDAETHIETLTYGARADYMSTGLTLLTPGGRPRVLRLIGQILRHPRRFAATLDPRGQGRRSLLLLVMQSRPSALRLRPGRRGLVCEQDPTQPVPATVEVAQQASAWLAEQTGGIAQSQLLDAVANIGLTAHPLGGAVIAGSPEDGVVDAHHRVFGYRNLLICDGSVVPVNLGTNPSLTITALAERAMSAVPQKS